MNWPLPRPRVPTLSKRSSSIGLFLEQVLAPPTNDLKKVRLKLTLDDDEGIVLVRPIDN